MEPIVLAFFFFFSGKRQEAGGPNTGKSLSHPEDIPPTLPTGGGGVAKKKTSPPGEGLSVRRLNSSWLSSAEI